MTQFYMDDNGGCYIVGTTRSYQDEQTMRELETDELVEVDCPDNFEDKISNGALVW